MTESDAMRVLMVRHGESTWNAVRRWQGQADPPLTERGEAQAVTAAERASELGPFDAVITSSLQRARRTGELLAARLGIELGDAILGLAERAAGEWEGLTRVEINDRYPGFLDEDRRPDGYEPDAEVVDRARQTLVALAHRSANGPLLVVSHGGVINALERDASEPWQRIDNLEGRWFDVDAGKQSVQPAGDRVRLILDEPVEATDTDRSYA